MKRFILPLVAAALAAAGCASAPSAQDKSLEPFTALDTKARNVLAEEIREPETVVAAVVDVDMRSDPRATLLRYTPVRFRPAANGDLRLHGLERERAFQSVSALRDAILKRYAKGTLGIVVFFNGAPAGIKTCREKGECLRDKLGIASGTRMETCYAVHAEQNAIVQAAKLGVSIDGATLYCTHQPCSMCCKMIINSGIKRVVYQEGYPDPFTQELFGEAGVQLERYEKA